MARCECSRRARAVTKRPLSRLSRRCVRPAGSRRLRSRKGNTGLSLYRFVTLGRQERPGDTRSKSGRNKGHTVGRHQRTREDAAFDLEPIRVPSPGKGRHRVEPTGTSAPVKAATVAAATGAFFAVGSQIGAGTAAAHPGHDHVQAEAPTPSLPFELPAACCPRVSRSRPSPGITTPAEQARPSFRPRSPASSISSRVPTGSISSTRLLPPPSSPSPAPSPPTGVRAGAPTTAASISQPRSERPSSPRPTARSSTPDRLPASASGSASSTTTAPPPSTVT